MAALDLTSSSSIVSATKSSSTYDVFINFRGKHLRKNFIGFLYKFMNDKGINVFLDNKKLQNGEEIGPALYEAIRSSKIAIPVFSEGYADSKWCLDELVEMVQCQKSNKQIIQPIFFNVDPSDVRHQTGTFENAFLEHQKFYPKKVESWREALRVVGSLKGEVIDETTNQVEVVELVIKRARRELDNNTPFPKWEYVDMHSRVKDLFSLLNIGSSDVQFVGICGSGGIGKTTLARAVYNDIFSTFDNCCFLSDIREQATQFGLVSLQKQFLKDIFKEDLEVKDLERGKGLIKEKISNKNVFLVLDDVDTKEQINALACNLDWFGKGSRVIITTRDECILDLPKNNGAKIYKPQLLDRVHSLQLFSWHAFQNNSQPPEDYMELSHDVVRHSGGLPLILEVFGSYLSNISDKDVWEDTLKALKEIPPGEVQRRLRISYDNLENDFQRNIFLDAACFFIGWKKETLISIWQGCGFHPEAALFRLIKRYLLKFDGEYLRMHDHIRDMGREIVLEKSRNDPSKRSRLWSYSNIVEVSSRHKEANTIEGVSLHHASKPHFDLTMESLKLMPNLRFLSISSQFECFSERSFQISSLYYRRLAYLKLSHNGSNQFWNDGPPYEHKRFQELKILDHSYCFNLSKSPNFSWFPSLEQLDFQGCESLEELDESIGQLSQLKNLILKRCKSLKKLPDSIGDLKSLEKLDLSYAGIEELPDSISGMCSLKYLILVDCNSLKILPTGIGLLEKLKVLNQIRQCGQLEDLQALPSCLVELCIEWCDSLVRLPDLSKLKMLRTLKLRHCKKLEEIPGLEEIKSLNELDARGSYKLTHTQRKIIQGTLEPYNRSLATSYGYSLTADERIYNSGVILFLVVDISNLMSNKVIFHIDVSASIQREDKKIICFHSLRVDHLDGIDGDVIYICHFKGFHWFGVPLHENDAIEISSIDAPHCRVTFCKVLFKNGELGTLQKPHENSNTLKWSYLDDYGKITLDYWSIKDEEREMSRRLHRVVRVENCPNCRRSMVREHWRHLKDSGNLRVCNLCYYKHIIINEKKTWRTGEQTGEEAQSIIISLCSVN